MNHLLVFVLLCALPLTACKRKPTSPPTASETTAAPANPEVDLPALNEAVRAHVMGLVKEPASLEDLVKAGFIKRLPTPPPGKKYVLSPDKTAVLLVKE